MHVLRTWTSTSPPHPPQPHLFRNIKHGSQAHVCMFKNVNIPTPPHPSPTCSVTSNMEVKLMNACSKNVNIHIPTPPHPNPTCSITSNMEVKLICACSKNVNILTPPHPNPTCSVTSNMALWHGRRNWHTRKASYRPWHHKHTYDLTCIYKLKKMFRFGRISSQGPGKPATSFHQRIFADLKITPQLPRTESLQHEPGRITCLHRLVLKTAISFSDTPGSS